MLALTIGSRMPKRLAIAAALAAISVSGCDRGRSDGQPAQTPESPCKGFERCRAGQAMPDSKLFNPDEEQATMAETAGRPVLVNLWASWCAPCVKELPTLDALSRRPGAPRIVLVSEDIGGRTSVDAFLESHGIGNLESWRDPNMALSAGLGVQVMPTTVYYDSSGREIWRYVGELDWTSDEAAKLLAEAGQGATR